MRILFGIIGILAAMAFVSYAAVTSYSTAYSMTTQFQELAGSAAAAMVMWEALGALFVQQCWRNGSKLMALGGAALVLAASVYLIRLDLRFHVAGQSDMTASREVVIENRENVRSEYEKAIARRDTLRKLKIPDVYEKRELANAEKRASDLEPRLWGAETVTSGGMPEAGWASRMLSGVSTDRQWWTDTLMVIGLLFWALARMLALPVAVASMQMSKREEKAVAKSPDLAEYHAAIKARQEAKEAQETEQFLKGITLASAPSSPLLSHTEAARVPSPQLPLVQALKDEPEIVDRVNLPSEEVGYPGSEEFFETNAINYKTKLQLTPKEQRRLAREQNLVKKSPNLGTDGVEVGDPEVWASLLLRPGKPNQSVTSGECRDNFREYCEMHGLGFIENKKLLSRQIGALIDRMSEADPVKGRRRARNAAGAVYHGWFLISPEDLAKLSPERARA